MMSVMMSYAHFNSVGYGHDARIVGEATFSVDNGRHTYTIKDEQHNLLTKPAS